MDNKMIRYLIAIDEYINKISSLKSTNAKTEPKPELDESELGEMQTISYPNTYPNAEKQLTEQTFIKNHNKTNSQNVIDANLHSLIAKKDNTDTNILLQQQRDKLKKQVSDSLPITGGSKKTPKEIKLTRHKIKGKSNKF